MKIPTSQIPVVATLLTVVLSGCGTMANLQGKRVAALGPSHLEPPQVLGGIRRDAKWLGACVEDAQEDPLLPIVKIPVYAFFVADMPFSLVGDLATIRMVKRLQLVYFFKHRDEQTETPDNEEVTAPDP